MNRYIIEKSPSKDAEKFRKQHGLPPLETTYRVYDRYDRYSLKAESKNLNDLKGFNK